MFIEDIKDDEQCEICGRKPDLLECSECGVRARMTNCGHQGQPRPIAADENGIPICEKCYHNRQVA